MSIRLLLFPWRCCCLTWYWWRRCCRPYKHMSWLCSGRSDGCLLSYGRCRCGRCLANQAIGGNDHAGDAPVAGKWRCGARCFGLGRHLGCGPACGRKCLYSGATLWRCAPPRFGSHPAVNNRQHCNCFSGNRLGRALTTRLLATITCGSALAAW